MWNKKNRQIKAGSHPLYKGDEDWSSVVYFTEKGVVGKIVEEWKLLRESNIWLLLIFVFINL